MRLCSSVRTMMGAEWNSRKATYGAMWVGLNGRRTIGQQRGVLNAHGVCNATASASAGGQVCYGWAEHNKPVITQGFQLSQGLTVLIHLENGVVNRIVWDSSCNLCPKSTGDVACMWDGTDIAVCCNAQPHVPAPSHFDLPRMTRTRLAYRLASTASGSRAHSCPRALVQLQCTGESGRCSDCYATLTPGSCTAQSAVCAPSIYLAWLGTDRHGQPLLSASSVLSRFAAHSLAGVGESLFTEVQRLSEDFA